MLMAATRAWSAAAGWMALSSGSPVWKPEASVTSPAA
jgi:hypothetical protein